MKINRLMLTVLAAFVVLLSGCGSDIYQDGGNKGGSNGGINGKITALLQGVTIDNSNGNIVASVDVSNALNSDGNLTLSAMKLTLDHCALVDGSVSASPDPVELAPAETKQVLIVGKLADPTCIPTSYQIYGSTKDGQGVEEKFSTANTSLDPSKITINDSSKTTLSVATKQLDINESGVTRDITVNVLQGSVGLANEGVKITSLNGIPGSFNSQSMSSDAAGDAVFAYTSPTPIVDNNFTVEFCLESDASVCDSANINLTTGVIPDPVDLIDNINYFITFVPNGGANNLALDTRNNAVVTLIDKDTKKPIANDRIRGITITSRDASVLKLTPEGGGAPASNITLGEKRNAVSVLLTADKFNSGLAVIEVTIEYTNLNGVLKTRGQLFSVAVLSGKPTAFSINDDGVGYSAETKQFEHKFIVQSTDASGNNVATEGFINVSAMASFARNAGREILYGRHSGGVSAVLSPSHEKATLELAGLAPFNTTNIDMDRAFVAVFGDVTTYEANGKWNIEDIASSDTLNLINEYHGEAHSNLGMAIGYNYRDKICTSTYEESVVVVDSADGTYKLDKTGKAIVVLKYDSYMVGKRAMILVNMTGLDPSTGKVLRSGEVHEQTLHFHTYLKGDTIKVPAGASNFTVGIRGIIDTGTGDEWALTNSTFHCELELNKVTLVPNSEEQNDPDSCSSEGYAFLKYRVNSTGDDGTVTFKKCQVDSRPLF